MRMVLSCSGNANLTVHWKNVLSTLYMREIWGFVDFVVPAPPLGICSPTDPAFTLSCRLRLLFFFNFLCSGSNV